nr:MAG TPA: hypothetical protein [Caudoviricetes sp.]
MLSIDSADAMSAARARGRNPGAIQKEHEP